MKIPIVQIELSSVTHYVLKWGIQMHTFAGLNRSNEEKLFDVTISVDAGWECHYNLPTPVALKINQYAISTSGLLSPR